MFEVNVKNVTEGREREGRGRDQALFSFFSFFKYKMDTSEVFFVMSPGQEERIQDCGLW